MSGKRNIKQTQGGCGKPTQGNYVMILVEEFVKEARDVMQTKVEHDDVGLTSGLGSLKGNSREFTCLVQLVGSKTVAEDPKIEGVDLVQSLCPDNITEGPMVPIIAQIRPK